jgi:hypothetical protein
MPLRHVTAAQCIASWRTFGWICVAPGGRGQDSNIASRPVLVYSGRSYSIIRGVGPFACLLSRTILAKEQYFSLIINQRTILLGMTFQQNEQGLMNLTTGLLQDGVLDMYYGIYMVDLSSYV